MRYEKRLGAVICVLAVITTSSAIAATISGTVFEDLNKNLKLDVAERGIAGVAVSNGVDVITTDVDGNYSLSIDDETVFFITKPQNYMTPVDKNNLPLFYHIHQPNGSPKMQYKGITPTGELPLKINFPLFSSPEPDAFDVFVTSDPQMRNATEVGYVRDDVVAEMIGTKASFGITLGDIVYDNLALYESYNQVMAQVGLPFYNTPGNHDMNYDAKDDHYSLETYKSVYGPPYYSYDYGSVHFVSMDSIGYLGKIQYTGKFGDKQLEWLKNDLKYVPMNKLIVFAMHIPLNGISDRKKLFEIVQERQHLLTIAGHTHTLEQSFITTSMGWKGAAKFPQCILSTVAGQWWTGPKDERGIPVSDQSDGTPNGYHLFSFKGNQFSQTYRAAGKSSDYQMRISSPDGIVTRGRSFKIIVNVFNGNALSMVEAMIDDGPPIKLSKTYALDPFIEKSYKTGYSGARASVCQHLWAVPIPEDITPGVHRVTVRTVDQYGREYKAAKIFEVADSPK